MTLHKFFFSIYDDNVCEHQTRLLTNNIEEGPLTVDRAFDAIMIYDK